MRNPLNTTAQIRIITHLNTPEERRWTLTVRPWVWVLAVVGGFTVGFLLSYLR